MPQPPKPATPTPILPEHTEKGSVHWYQFSSSPDARTLDLVHPCIIIGRFNGKSSRVLISPISDLKNYTERGQLKYPYHTALLQCDYPFLDKDSAVLLDQVLTIPKSELCEEWYIGKVTDTSGVDQALIHNYDLYASIRDVFTELLNQLENNHHKNFTRR